MPAQGSETGQSFGAVIIWMVVLIAVIAAVWLGMVMMKRRLHTESSLNRSTWTLDDLRTLRESGELSDGEFERLRAHVVGQARATGCNVNSEESAS